MDSNISAAYMKKESKYIPFIQNLSQLYSHYKYEAVTIVIGAMGALPKSFKYREAQQIHQRRETKDLDTKNSKGNIARNSKNLANSTEDVEQRHVTEGTYD